MKTTQFIPSAAVLALTLALSGCAFFSGGSGGGSSVSPGIGEVKPLAENYEDANGAHVESFIAYEDADGNDMVEVNGEALVIHYSNSNDSVRDSSGEFLVFRPGHGAGTRDGESWWEMRSNGDNAPVLVQYRIDPTDSIDSVQATAYSVESLGARQRVGTEFAVNYGTEEDLFTAEIAGDGFVVQGDTEADNMDISLGDGYRYRAYADSHYCTGVRSAAIQGYCDSAHVTVAAYSHLWQAEHAALYVFHHDTAFQGGGDHDLPFARFYTYGDLTRRQNLPVSSEASYAVNALGVYLDQTTPGNDKFLHGTGNLIADFDSRYLLLDLEVKDHDGEDFLTVTDQELELSGTHNIFHNFECEVGTAADNTCVGGFGYANPAIEGALVASPEVKGSFYGPSGEEVAGNIYHGNADHSINMGFIGQQSGGVNQ